MEGGQPGRGAGWLGVGRPIKVRQGYTIRDLEDGAGLFSPGRWTPSKRRLPDVGKLAKNLVEAMGLNLGDWGNIVLRMMAGRMEGDPFTSTQRAAGTQFLSSWLADQGFRETPTDHDFAHDPKFDYCRLFSDGATTLMRKLRISSQQGCD